MGVKQAYSSVQLYGRQAYSSVVIRTRGIQQSTTIGTTGIQQCTGIGTEDMRHCTVSEMAGKRQGSGGGAETIQAYSRVQMGVVE